MAEILRSSRSRRNLAEVIIGKGAHSAIGLRIGKDEFASEIGSLRRADLIAAQEVVDLGDDVLDPLLLVRDDDPWVLADSSAQAKIDAKSQEVGVHRLVLGFLHLPSEGVQELLRELGRGGSNSLGHDDRVIVEVVGAWNSDVFVDHVVDGQLPYSWTTWLMAS